MAYAPSPGTYGYRVHEYLKADPSRECTMSMLCELALGGNCTPQNLKDCVDPLVQHGLLERFTRQGLTRPAFYRVPRVEAFPLPTSAPVVVEDEPMGRRAPTHDEVIELARSGASAARPFDAWITGKPDGVDIDRVNRVADSVTVNTPRRALTAMQARGEVMESEACTSATDRGGNAAPAGAAGPAFHTPREGRDVLKAEPRGRRYVDSPAASEAPTHSTALNGTAETPAPGQRETASRATPMRCALWSDGTLAIERGKTIILFSVAESALLRAYLCGGVPD